MDAAPPPTEEEPAALRLTFAYDRDRVRLVSQERVAMLAPPDDTELLEVGRSGYWLELRDDNNDVLYRQVLHDPIRTDAEVFPEDPSQPIRRVPIAHPQGTFEVVVPDLPGGRIAVLHGRPSRQELRERPAKQLVKARLSDRGTRPPRPDR
jgi:hypothetical protein